LQVSGERQEIDGKSQAFLKVAVARVSKKLLVIALAVGSLAPTGLTEAAELTLLSPRIMKPALSDLIPEFERSSGQQVTISYISASVLVREIEEGKTGDVVILSPRQIEQLRNKGKIVDDNFLPIAKIEYGVFVRRGAPKPDLSRVRMLKQTLLSAKSIALGDPRNSTTGSYFANLIERLQIADAVKPKIKTFSSGTAALEAIAAGEADLGVWVISGANEPGIELAGVLPAQAKKFNAYTAGILMTSNQKQAAKALVSFMSSANSLATMKSKGYNAP
jgi:molybdate transport system substrate-binding protein